MWSLLCIEVQDDHVKGLNLKELAKDVEPFLFQPSDSKKIILFSDYIKQVKL